MEQEVANFARFYALFAKLPGADKETLVYQYTNGRTTHLHLMAASEYQSMCNEMERVAGYDERREAWRREMKRKRSAVLQERCSESWMARNWMRCSSSCASSAARKKILKATNDECRIEKGSGSGMLSGDGSHRRLRMGRSVRVFRRAGRLGLWKA